MKIFYISYWGVREGLTVSTVFPNLQILSEDNRVDTIDFFTVERNEDESFKDKFKPIDKVFHHPIFSKNLGFFLFTKIADWLRIKNTIIDKAKRLKPDLIICRGSMAGAFGVMLYKRFRIPFVVESFEPHADYMLDSGVWKKNGLRYRYQQKTEKEIKINAKYLITVSNAYANKLNQLEKIPLSKIRTVPCMVSSEDFAFSESKRKEIRDKIKIDNSYKVAIYVGKFGSIYYDEAAFMLFRAIDDYYQKKFFLIILGPTSKDQINKNLKQVGFDENRCFSGIVSHKEVSSYLSAADFAINLHKSTANSIAYSPIKNGEYWANGLPILIPENIGDDSSIIELEGGGAVYCENSPDSIAVSLQKIEEEIKKGRIECLKLAKKYRNPDIGKKIYNELLQDIDNA